MMLAIDIEADGEWDSSTDWSLLARRAAEAAVAESAFPQLADSTCPVEIYVRLTSDEHVRALNAEWRRKDKPTNVLSFPMAEPYQLEQADEDGPEIMLGDVVLARGICAAEAAAKAIPIEDHAAHLLVHGTLHLLGDNHHDDETAAKMEQREVRALARLGIANPYESAG